MAIGDLGAVLDDLEVLFRQGTTAGLSDVQLLDRFLRTGEVGGEVAFTTLVQRHGPMVLRVCRGELNDLHAAEDAFQATFLILARQARTIRDGACLASWLYGVARRVARRARLDRARRTARERRRARMYEDARRLAPEPPELLPEVQEELDRLPERYRSPIVLCYLEGRTHEEAARSSGSRSGPSRSACRGGGNGSAAGWSAAGSRRHSPPPRSRAPPVRRSPRVSWISPSRPPWPSPRAARPACRLPSPHSYTESSGPCCSTSSRPSPPSPRPRCC